MVVDQIRCRSPAAENRSSERTGLRCAGGTLRAARKGPHTNRRSRPLPIAQADRRVRRRPLCLGSPKHFTSWLGLAPSNKISGGKVLSSRTRRCGTRAAALLRLAAVTVGRTDTALGAFYRRLSARIGKAKAVTATARKIAVLFYNVVRHGMEFVHPGASYYETRYRTRVIDNLHRRAKVLRICSPAYGADTRRDRFFRNWLAADIFRSSQTRVPHNDANFGIGTLGRPVKHNALMNGCRNAQERTV